MRTLLAVIVVSLALVGVQANAAGAMAVSNWSLYFDTTNIGTEGQTLTTTFTNDTGSDQALNFSIGGPAADDFSATTDCPFILSPGESCDVDVTFSPTAYEQRKAYLFFGNFGDYQHSVQLVGAGSVGYTLVTDNDVASEAGAAPRLTTYEGPLSKPIVGAASTRTGKGLWTLAGDGGVFSAGDAQFHGSTGGMRLNQPVVGIAATPTGEGYWLVAADGGMFSFGDAVFHGSTGSLHLNKPIVGMVPTETGDGYWLVASDGGIFAFGDAVFHGSTGDLHLNSPIVGMAATPSGEGYWFVAADGGVFSFGDARFKGGLGGGSLSAPVTGMAAAPFGLGYWLVQADGNTHNYGDAPILVQQGRVTSGHKVVAIAPSAFPPF